MSWLSREYHPGRSASNWRRRKAEAEAHRSWRVTVEEIETADVEFVAAPCLDAGPVYAEAREGAA